MKRYRIMYKVFVFACAHEPPILARPYAPHKQRTPAHKVNTRELAMYQWTIIPFIKHIVTLAAHSKIS